MLVGFYRHLKKIKKPLNRELRQPLKELGQVNKVAFLEMFVYFINAKGFRFKLTASLFGQLWQLVGSSGRRTGEAN
jgi:hypothetical protein